MVPGVITRIRVSSIIITVVKIAIKVFTIIGRRITAVLSVSVKRY